jgi:uncharacterized protein YndB with AHSA1/START domain
MPVCEIDLRVGGAYRYVRGKRVRKSDGMSGIYREIATPERLVATEKFDRGWYPGKAVGTLILSEQNGTTTITQAVLYNCYVVPREHSPATNLQEADTVISWFLQFVWCDYYNRAAKLFAA